MSEAASVVGTAWPPPVEVKMRLSVGAVLVSLSVGCGGYPGRFP